MNQAVNAAKVDEHTIGSDVLNLALNDLTLLKLRHNLLLLLFEFSLDEHLVADDNILVLAVNLNDFEFHRLVNKDIVVADGLDVDLRTGQECLDAEHVNDHTTLGAALHETGNDFVVLESLVHASPGGRYARLLVRKNELACLVLLRFDVNLHFVADFEIGIVAELRCGNHTLALVTNVNDHLTLVDAGNRTFDYLVGVDRI